MDRKPGRFFYRSKAVDNNGRASGVAIVNQAGDRSLPPQHVRPGARSYTPPFHASGSPQRGSGKKFVPNFQPG